MSQTIEVQNINSGLGFNYHLEEEIHKRQRIQKIFNQLSWVYQSSQIEVPLIVPVSSFLGNKPKPLNEKQVQKLFIGHIPDGRSMAVRYEGTALVAQKIANDLKNNKSVENSRHHYFQEMVRLEYTNDLDSKHFRSFYQAGLEMFTSNIEQHSKNKIDLVSYMADFISSLGSNPCLRISHVDIVQMPLSNVNIPNYDKRRIAGFLEDYNYDELYEFLRKIKFNVPIGKIILELAEKQICSLDEGLNILKKYPQFYLKAIRDIEYLAAHLAPDVLNICKFDGGIRRSLDFYSGLVFQCDLGDMRECAGGGDFTGLVEAFGAERQIYGIGMAAGVERLMEVFKD